MIHRTARERLLFEGREAAEDVESLKGIRGHTATLGRWAHGPARIVRVSHDGALVTCGDLRPNRPNTCGAGTEKRLDRRKQNLETK